MDCTSPIFGIYPCGKCINCRARSRQEWVFRLRMEYQRCDFGLFVTLTYDDESLPPGGVCKRDVQLFLKRLRKHFPSRSLRYYITSEYGDHGLRPHYHGLMFFKCQRTNDIYDIIEQSWIFGFVQFGEIEEGSIVYCTKYCLKGSDIPPGMNDNFRLMSKMSGGIGSNHVDQMKEYYTPRLDKPQIVTSGKSTSPMPRYYRARLLNSLDPDDKEAIKALYLENLERLRSKRKQKLLQQFRQQHPGVDPDDRILPSDSTTRFDIWLTERNERRSEAVNNHTKKQNIW